ncbi:phosphatase PAP2 family protein [Cellulomonas fengjieae]|uniref:Phosphatase PAP2 family protein n=1 Tax=Cellulomonas fengjieae TaxID=2819978 RepID=A0ABS3SBF1_9CELL|nr:phosphatase PAP2 family protein [Cellulomonas fengjieae]MBO3083079.1 phosphatase PAP2 family protein [Cellulomonas fengjieae]QVI65552.1 phosphatase PAP2 family protein [Cellulomonas fengjieae]
MRPLPLRRRALLRAAVFGVALTVPVAVLAYLVRAQVGGVVRLDELVNVAATAYTREHPDLQQALLVWQELFQARWVNLAATLVCVWVWRRHGLTTRALWAFLTIMAAWAVQLGAKGLVQRARPVVEDALAHAPGSSFPSGHAANTAAVALTLTLLLWPLLGRRGRVVVPVVAATATLLTGLDRVLLGVHYPSDVVAGFALGTALAGASYLGYSGWSVTPPDQET